MPASPYLRFALTHRRFVGFGFAAAFLSSFGQTYFIGVFGPSIRAAFDLSHTGWSSIYLVGTLLSGLLLPSTGKQIDTRSLPVYTFAVGAALAVGCGLMAVAPGPVLLAVAIFALRQSGQGLMSHIAITSMARYFDKGRGRAIALATLGFAAGEATLPVLALAVVGAIGWRWSFAAIGIGVALVFVPLLLILLRGHGERHAEHLENLSAASAAKDAQLRSWTRGEVLRDPHFYFLLPGVLAPAMVLTALFFHHLSLADAKGWSHSWITGSYVIYAGATTAMALVCGPLIDRIGGVRLVPPMLLPLGLALVVAGTMRQPWSVVPYFVLMGATIGISHTAVAAMWAEVYGVGSLGAIKSLVSALAVLASALGPVTMAAFMDRGVGIETVCLGYAVYVVVASAIMAATIRRRLGQTAA